MAPRGENRFMGQVNLSLLWHYFCKGTNREPPHHTGMIYRGTLSIILIRSNVILVASDPRCLRWHSITRALHGSHFLPPQLPPSALFVIFLLLRSSSAFIIILSAPASCTCKLRSHLFCSRLLKWPASLVTIKIVYESCHLARSWLNSSGYTSRGYPAFIHISLSERCSEPLIDFNWLFNHRRIMHTHLSVWGITWHLGNLDWERDWRLGWHRLLYIISIICGPEWALEALLILLRILVMWSKKFRWVEPKREARDLCCHKVGEYKSSCRFPPWVA